MDTRNGEPGRSLERLSETTLALVDAWAKRKGLLLFIETDGCLSAFPKYRRGKINPDVILLQKMLAGHHPEMKMFLIRTTLGEDNT